MSRRTTALAYAILAAVVATAIWIAGGDESEAAIDPGHAGAFTDALSRPPSLPAPYAAPIRYAPDPSSPPTTVASPPVKSIPEDPPESSITVMAMPLAGGSDQAYRVVLDTAGQVVAKGLPGQPIEPISDGPSGLAAYSYQSDIVFLSDNTTHDVYNADLWVYIYPAQLSDPDTWTGSARKTSGYVWFNALHVRIGSDASDTRFNMHAGIACGNGISNRWYFSWGGYRADGTALGPGIGNGILLNENRWYRIRIWRVSQSGSSWSWGAWVRDESTGVERYAGSWWLTSGRMISNAAYFTEIAEPRVGVTDYVSTHNKWVMFRDPAGEHIYKTGTAYYDYTVANTNLMRSGPHIDRYTIDHREVTRTTPRWTVLFNNP